MPTAEEGKKAGQRVRRKMNSQEEVKTPTAQHIMRSQVAREASLPAQQHAEQRA